MKILVVGPSWVGDAIMAQSLYKIIAEDQDNQIEVLSPEWSQGILSRMNEVHCSISSPFLHGQLALSERRSLGISLKDKRYDQAIILTNSLKSSLVPYFAEIPIRTGWLGELRYGLINDVRRFNNQDCKLMVQQFSVLGPQKKNLTKEEIPDPHLHIDKVNLDKLLDKFEMDNQKRSIALCPGAEFGPAKRWPPCHYSKIAKEYIARDWNVIILGSENDAQVAFEIKEPLKAKASLFDLTGKTSLVDAVDIMSSCNLVLTNDSGLMHVAAAVKVPLLALYGPSSPEFTPPLSAHAKTLRKISGYKKIRSGDMKDGYHSSLYNLEPREVLQELEQLLEKSS